MRQKVASTSQRAHRKLDRSLGKTRRSAKMADRRGLATAPRGGADQFFGRARAAGPAGSKPNSMSGPDVTDDLPEFAAALDRELDAIETYLGASLDEMLGRLK
jgi:hypothetical protein